MKKILCLFVFFVFICSCTVYRGKEFYYENNIYFTKKPFLGRPLTIDSSSYIEDGQLKILSFMICKKGYNGFFKHKEFLKENRYTLFVRFTSRSVNQIPEIEIDSLMIKYFNGYESTKAIMLKVQIKPSIFQNTQEISVQEIIIPNKTDRLLLHFKYREMNNNWKQISIYMRRFEYEIPFLGMD